MASSSLPYVTAQGGPYERGFQHGRQCGDLIQRYPDVLLETIAVEASWRALDRSRAPIRREDLLRCASAFLPSLEAFAPWLVEEVRGIADGAKLPFLDVLLVNVRAEVMGLLASGATTAAEGCTAFAVGRTATADGSILAGQNLDQDRLNQDLLIVLRVEPDHGPSILMCTFAGLVGYTGVNSAGVSLFQNALSTPVWRADGMPHYFMKRALLEQTDLRGCLDVIGRARVCSSGNYVLTDRTNLVDVEVTPDGFATLSADDDVLVHTNHFVAPSLVDREALLPRLPDSACRAPRMRDLLRAQSGRVSVETLKAALSDHDGHPTSICRHQGRMISIASMIAEPDQGRLWVSVGNPCENPYVGYEL